MQSPTTPLRITAVRTARVEIPLERPLRTSIHEISNVCCQLVTLETDAGIVGEGYGFCFNPDRLAAISRFTESLAPLVIGQDPHDVESLWDKFIRDCNFYGQSGVSILAYTPIDVACWDLIGKAANAPLYRLFGACRDRVPAYASGGLWLSASLDELVAQAREFLRQGFRAMKMRLGSANWKDDVARVEAVRAAIGDGVTLMADANQGLSLHEALRLGRALEPFNLAWYEEPVPTWQDDAAAKLVDSLSMPLASGETEYTRYGIRRMVQNRAAARLMGIPIRRAVAVAFALSALFAGIAGVLIAPLMNVHSDMGTLFGLKAFAVAILGGITSAWGVMIAGLIFGLAEATITTTLGSGYTQILTFALVIAALAWRPNGLFGRAEVKKV